LQALEVYPNNWLKAACFQRRDLRFCPAGDSKHYTLRCEPAPPATSVMWRNFGLSIVDRRLRLFVAYALAALLLCASAAFLVLAGFATRSIQDPLPTAASCTKSVSAAEATASVSLANCYCVRQASVAALRDPLCRHWLEARGLALGLQAVSSTVTVRSLNTCYCSIFRARSPNDFCLLPYCRL
jgi:hypothetical protein